MTYFIHLQESTPREQYNILSCSTVGVREGIRLFSKTGPHCLIFVLYARAEC